MAIVIAIDDNILKCKIELEECVIIGDTGRITLSEAEKLPVEVIKILGQIAIVQCFEDTSGVREGMEIKFTGTELSAQFGPGLIGQIYDGLQNSLDIMAEHHGNYLTRGKEFDKLNNSIEWDFTPIIVKGAKVSSGDWIGEVPEFHFMHKIMVPYSFEGSFIVKSIVSSGKYSINDVIAVLEKDGEEYDVTMTFTWPVKKAFPKRAYKERYKPSELLVTGVRILDILSPICLGGTACVPGPFGAGKTVLQHGLSKFARIDLVIVAACGERAGEIVEIFQEFPELKDGEGRPLMDRTIIIGNTSAMPVAARESSIYLAITLAEYYRAMGMSVLLLADSTSRWAQALREASGRLEEIPGEEAFPAYLESRIAEFYERAGEIKLNNGVKGSITVVGTVSPAGGNFQEPVTQATLATVGAFWGLSRERAEARKFPSIEPTESWSKYKGTNDLLRKKIIASLIKGKEVKEMMMVVGKEGVSNEDFVNNLKSETLDKCVIQQNAFDVIDAFSSPERITEISKYIEMMLEFNPKQTKKSEIESLFDEITSRWVNWNYISEKEDDKYNTERDNLFELLSGGVQNENI